MAGRDITDKDVMPRLLALQKAGEAMTGVLVQETVEDVIDDALLASEAKAASFQPPAGAADDEALAEAWSKERFMPGAQGSVTDADLTAWFAERRGMARMVFTEEAAAAAVKAGLDAELGKPDAKPLEVFLAAKAKLGKKNEVVPDGVLVDAQGKNELGEALLPEGGAKALFALERDGQVSAPTQVGDLWVLLLRVGVRPGTPLAEVPPDQKQAAKDKLAARRAMDSLDEHLARLRKDQNVQVDEIAVRKLAKRVGVSKLGKLKRMPFAARKMHLGRGSGHIPAKVPMRPGGREVERLLQERAKEKVEGGNP